MSEDTRVVINAGGKLFETSTTTLLASGSGYFEGLLGSTGETMRGKKRARVGADGDDDAASRRELFVDRDPDIFGDVLKYMRGNRLPAAVRADAHRLDDLKAEAEFFAYDRLVAACDEAMAALSDAAPHARSLFFVVEKGQGDENPTYGDDVVIDVPKGQVLYITQVSPSFLGVGGHIVLRATPSPKYEQGAHRMTIAQHYVPGGQEITGAPNEAQQRALKSMGHITLNLMLDGGEDERVVFDAICATFTVIAWVGHPSKIPGLGARTN